MIYTISNDLLEVSIASAGAELMSIMSKADRHEYLWQGDSKYWGGRAYNLFPICGRLTNGVYTYQGVTYSGMKSPHGFVRKAELEASQTSGNAITFTLKADDSTLACYPFDFVYSITYTLTGSTIDMHIQVKNEGTDKMIFSLGGHPGFNLPFDDDKFEDGYIEFADAKAIKEVYMSDTCFTTPERKDFALDGGKVLNMRHNLFDRDAIVLQGVKDSVTLKSRASKREVKVSFPSEMKYLGLWHAPKTDAPYVAIEPWCSLPAYDNVVDDFATKPDMFTLDASKTFALDWSISVK